MASSILDVEEGSIVSAGGTATHSSERREFAAGENVLSPGKAGRLYRVESGLVRLYTVDPDDSNDTLRSVTLRYVKPRGYFGEECLTGAPRWYFAESVTPSMVSVLDPESLEESEQRELTRSLAASLDAIGRSLRRLARKPLRARVAAEILELSDSELASRGEDGAAVVWMTHDDLANAVGSVRETVTKVVGDLVRLGAVRAGYGKIIVRDGRMLREVAGE